MLQDLLFSTGAHVVSTAATLWIKTHPTTTQSDLPTYDYKNNVLTKSLKMIS